MKLHIVMSFEFDIYYLLKDLISNIDIPEGGINDSRYLADSFEVTLTEEATHIE